MMRQYARNETEWPTAPAKHADGQMKGVAMRRYEAVEREVVTRKECVCVICDMCGREAEHPRADDMPFSWGTVGSSFGRLKMAFCIDGDYDDSQLDLCYDCAEWLIDKIERGDIGRKRQEDGHVQ